MIMCDKYYLYFSLAMRHTDIDLRSVLDAIGILNADTDPATLPARTDGAVRRLVPTDVLSFEAFGSDNYYQGPLWYTPDGSITADDALIMGELVSGHPCFEDIAGQRIRDAVRISDYVPIADFKRTAIYNEFFRRLGTDRQLVAGLPVHGGLMISVSLCRLRTDFTDRDCGIFDLLTPHLVSAFRNAQLINRLRFESEQLEVALDATQFGMITVDKDLNTHIRNPAAVELLGKYFEGGPDSMPDELTRYVRHYLPVLDGPEFYLPPLPYEVVRQNSKLIVRLTFDAKTKTAVLLLEERCDPAILSYAGHRLTKRESGVLHLIGNGKTNAEIGLLLNISARTVQKHVEHIFDKLGVETRTAAAMAVFSIQTLESRRP
jgi:DNA-binding CsgD family transcriptional regulator